MDGFNIAAGLGSTLSLHIVIVIHRFSKMLAQSRLRSIHHAWRFETAETTLADVLTGPTLAKGHVTGEFMAQVGLGAEFLVQIGEALLRSLIFVVWTRIFGI